MRHVAAGMAWRCGLLAFVLLLPLNLLAIGKAPGDIAAFLIGKRGSVEAYQDQHDSSGRFLKKSWVELEKGDPLHIQDSLRAGPGSRAVFEFADRYEEDGFVAGPSIFTIGPETTVEIASFDIDYDRADPSRPRPSGIIELIRGTMRMFIKGWGQRSDFSVRAGLAICGLRGTDASFDYDPDQERLTVTVHEGEVVVAGPRGSKIVRAGETQTLSDIKPTSPGVAPPS